MIFRVDKDRSGAISTDELQQALSNGNHKIIKIKLIVITFSNYAEVANIFVRVYH